MPLTAKPALGSEHVELKLERARLYLDDIESMIDIARGVDPDLHLSVETRQEEFQFTDVTDLLELPPRPVVSIGIQSASLSIFIGKRRGSVVSDRPSDKTRGAIARILELSQRRRRMLAALAHWWLWAGALVAYFALQRIVQVPVISSDRGLAASLAALSLLLVVVFVASSIPLFGSHTLIIPRRRRELPSLWERHSTTVAQGAIAVIAAVVGAVIGVVIGPAITSWLK